MRIKNHLFFAIYCGNQTCSQIQRICRSLGILKSTYAYVNCLITNKAIIRHTNVYRMTAIFSNMLDCNLYSTAIKLYYKTYLRNVIH